MWLDAVAFAQAAIEVACAFTNLCFFLRYLGRKSLPSRRVAAAALALINLALGLEASLFLLPATRSGVLDEELARATALVLVRGSLLAAAAFVSLLVWRQSGRRPR